LKPILVLLLSTSFVISAVAGVCAASRTFSLTITAAQAEVKSGSEPTVNTTLTNLSNRVATLEFTNPLCDYVVEVRDSSGNLAPDTEVKRESDCASHAAGRDIIVQLRPHESHKDTIPLSMFSDMSKPGKYSVQIMSKSPKEFGGVAAKSNTITVTVTE
jgi:hypothetical protein